MIFANNNYHYCWYMEMEQICVVIPFYNESARFDTDAFSRFYAVYTTIYFCLVNDGSIDNTIDILNNLGENATRIKVLNLEQNVGKAEAVRQGIIEAQGWQSFDYVAYLDADFSAPLETIPYLLQNRRNALFILGSRVLMLGSNIQRNAFRHYVGRIFATLASEMLNLPVYDSQCGAKVFHVSLIEKAFSNPFITTWLFDLEIIMRIVNHLGWEKFKSISIEIPLKKWIEKGGSKVKLSYIFHLPFDLIKIRRKYGKAI